MFHGVLRHTSARAPAVIRTGARRSIHHDSSLSSCWMGADAGLPTTCRHAKPRVIRSPSQHDVLVQKHVCHHRRGFTTSTSSIPAVPKKPVSIAIVGSGPSGCYTAKYLLVAFEKQFQQEQGKPPAAAAETHHHQQQHRIDVFDRLCTPYGLVRYGVAPDHPEVKNVQNDFDTLFQDKGVRFFGNVNVGQDVSVHELRERYDAVVLSYGCESDRKLGVPGEELAGVLSARKFVAWYNGHPSYDHVGEQVSKALGATKEQGVRDASVVVVGQGNVALDCARVLAKASPGLYDTDLAARALPVLGDGVARISIVGRRGHNQGAFTIKEVRELTKLEEEGHHTSFVVRSDELDMGATPASQSELEGPQGRPKLRIDKLLRKAASTVPNPDLPKKVELRFLLNPVRFEPRDDDPTSLGAVVCERTRLEGGPGQQRALGTGQYEKIPAKLALVSIGYKSIALNGIERWFDVERNVLKHEHGRVDGATSTLGGLYTAGWLKRGPTGIIGTNIGDARDTVATILTDLSHVDSFADARSSSDILSELKGRGIQVVEWEGYRRIEEQESARRRSNSQPREKIVRIEEQLEAASIGDSRLRT